MRSTPTDTDTFLSTTLINVGEPAPSVEGAPSFQPIPVATGSVPADQTSPGPPQACTASAITSDAAIAAKRAGVARETLTNSSETLGQKKSSIWSATSSKSSAENAFAHWEKHRAEFPELANAKQYVDAAKRMTDTLPGDALRKTRGADTLIYHPPTNTFVVQGTDGAPRTMFRPKDGIEYWNRQ